MLRILCKVMKIFRKKNPLEPAQGFAYAVQTGDYVGEMFVYVDSNILTHNFLSVPAMKNRNIPKNQFILGMNNHIIEFVEKVPKQVFRVIEAQYKENENSNHRRQQPDSPHFLDCEEPIEKD